MNSAFAQTPAAPAAPAAPMLPLQYWFYLGAIGALALWLGLRALRSGDPARRRTGAVVLALVALTAVWVALPRLAALTRVPVVVGVAEDIARLLQMAWWLTLTLLAALVLETHVWPGLPRRGIAIPRLLPQIVRAVVLAVALFGVISALTDQSVTGVLATSGIIAIVMGFALQSTLNDLFSGIALNLERPFRVGDWIQIDRDVVGEVLEVNWRATRLRTRSGNLLILPNSKVAGAQLLNFNSPVTRFRTTVQISADIRVPVRRVEALLVSAAARCIHVLTEPPPMAIVKEYRDATVLYDVQYWADSFTRDYEIRNEVLANFWAAFDMAGIPVGPAPADAVPPREPLGAAQLLRHVELFAGLDEAAHQALARAMVRMTFAAREDVVSAGETAQSLYVIAEGVLEVAIDVPGQGRRTVARLGPGDFFGEMSLLTGETRSAHVRALLPAICHVIDKPALAPVLHANRGCLAQLSEIAAQRKIANSETLHALPAQTREDMAAVEGAAILARIRAFFGLSEDPPAPDGERRAAE